MKWSQKRISVGYSNEQTEYELATGNADDKIFIFGPYKDRSFCSGYRLYTHCHVKGVSMYMEGEDKGISTLKEAKVKAEEFARKVSKIRDVLV